MIQISCNDQYEDAVDELEMTVDFTERRMVELRGMGMSESDIERQLTPMIEHAIDLYSAILRYYDTAVLAYVV